MPDEASPNVGTELLFENDRVRVWDLRLGPGERVPRHRHENDYVFICVTPGQLTVYADGEQPETSEVADGYVEYAEVGDGVAHGLGNDGRRNFREVLVEIKGPSISREPREPEDNGRAR